MENTRRRGERGEEVAARYLEGRGWEILDRNFRDGPREIDLVARRGDVLAFVEVKSRTGRTWGDPLESITPRKRREIETATRAWLVERRLTGTSITRFDAVSVVWRPGGRVDVEHVPDAWRAGDR